MCKRIERRESFLNLVRLGIGHNITPFHHDIDWISIESLAAKQGLFAIIFDGMEFLPESQRPPEDKLIPWIGSTLVKFEHRYDLYCRTIADLAGWYHAHGYKMMVLKGYACTLDWPKPEHRPCGDIDIWLFGKQKAADATMIREKGLQVDNTHHHHTIFFWQNFMVENHYDFINVHHHKSNKKLETILKKLGEDDSYYIELYGEKVYLPSPDLHALFLVRHAMKEFAAIGINLRQILDWAFFVEKHTNLVNWKQLLTVLDDYHMRVFFDIINAICVEDLGFDTKNFPFIQHNPSLKENVLNDILSTDISAPMPSNTIMRVIWKYRRWKNNKWKHELCYQESMWSALWSGVWGHLLKPSTI